MQHLNCHVSMMSGEICFSFCFFLLPESHQEDHAEGRRGGEDCDGGSCDHLYPSNVCVV